VKKRGLSEENYSDKILKKLHNIIASGSQRSLVRVESQVRLTLKEKPSFSKDMKLKEQRPSVSKEQRPSVSKEKKQKVGVVKPVKLQGSDYYQYMKGNKQTEKIYNGEKISKNKNNLMSTYFNILGNVAQGTDKRAVSVPKRVY